MKKYFFLIILIPLMGFAQNSPVTTDSTFFYADSISTTITLDKNEFLGQVWVDANRSKTLYVQQYDDSKQQWSWLFNPNGSKYVITTDSTINTVITLEPWRWVVAKKFKFIISKDPADTLSMRYDKRIY